MTAFEEQSEYELGLFERIAAALERIADCLERAQDGSPSFGVRQIGAWITREDRP